MVFKLQELKFLLLESISYVSAELAIRKLTYSCDLSVGLMLLKNHFRAIYNCLVQSGFCSVDDYGI